MWQALLEENVLTHGEWQLIQSVVVEKESLIKLDFLLLFLLLFLHPSPLGPVNKEQPFKDKCFLYRFRADEEGSPNHPTTDDVNNANDHIREALTTLLHRGPDATLRMILRKP